MTYETISSDQVYEQLRVPDSVRTEKILEK